MEEAIKDTLMAAAAVASMRTSIIAGAMGKADNAEIVAILRGEQWTIRCVADGMDTTVTYGDETQEVKEAIKEIQARANVRCRKDDLETMTGLRGYRAYILVANGGDVLAVTFE